MISEDILKPIIINLDRSPGLVVMGGNQIWARSIGEASPISIFQKVEEASPISTRLDFCRDIIPLEISRPYLVETYFLYVMGLNLSQAMDEPFLFNH